MYTQYALIACMKTYTRCVDIFVYLFHCIYCMLSFPRVYFILTEISLQGKKNPSKVYMNCVVHAYFTGSEKRWTSVMVCRRTSK